MGAQTARDLLRPVRKEVDPLARFAVDLLMADRWFTEAGKAELLGDRLTAEVYRVRGERIHDRIVEILDEVQHDNNR